MSGETRVGEMSRAGTAFVLELAGFQAE